MQPGASEIALSRDNGGGQETASLDTGLGQDLRGAVDNVQKTAAGLSEM